MDEAEKEALIEAVEKPKGSILKRILYSVGAAAGVAITGYLSVPHVTRAPAEQAISAPANDNASLGVALQYQKDRIDKLEQEQIRFRQEYLADLREVKGDIKELLQRTPRRRDVSELSSEPKEKPN